MSRKSGFTLIETLVVLAIIAILVAILFPVISAARVRAHLTACVATLYQHGRAAEMPDDGVDTTHCPYPQGDDDGAYIEVGQNYQSHDPNYAPDGGTVRTFCVEHLQKNSDGTFLVPLTGKFPVLRFAGGTGIIDAKGVTRWKRMSNGSWTQIPETGIVPVWPEIWHFPATTFRLLISYSDALINSPCRNPASRMQKCIQPSRCPSRAV